MAVGCALVIALYLIGSLVVYFLPAERTLNIDFRRLSSDITQCSY